METKIFDIKLPTSWAELSDKQLLLVFELFARDLSAAEVKTLCLMKWNRLKVLGQLPDKRFLVKRKGEPEVPLSASQGRRTLHRSGTEPVLPRIWPVAGLRHRQKNSPWYHGDIGREKGGNRDVDNSVGGHLRKAKKWFSRKYYASVMNIREFLADNLGNEFVGIVARSLDDNYRRYNH